MATPASRNADQIASMKTLEPIVNVTGVVRTSAPAIQSHGDCAPARIHSPRSLAASILS